MKIHRLLSLLLFIGAGSSSAGPTVAPVEPGTAARIIYQPPIVSLREKLSDLAVHASVEQLVAELRRVAVDFSLDPIAKEHLLREGVMHLSQLHPTASARTLVDELESRAPIAHVWLSEGQYRTPVPLYDVGAAARFAGQNWARAAGRAQTRLDLARGTAQYLDFFTRGAPGDRSFGLGAIDAFEAAGRNALLAQRNTISAAIETDRSVGPLAVVMARRLADKPLFLTLGRVGDPAVVMRVISSVGQYLERDDALDVLEAAAARPTIASAAMLAIGRLAPASPRARQYLLHALANEQHGGSAAAALSRLSDPDIAIAVAEVLKSSDSERTQRRAILALGLDGSPAARQALSSFAADPASPPALQQATEKWLQD